MVKKQLFLNDGFPKLHACIDLQMLDQNMFSWEILPNRILDSWMADTGDTWCHDTSHPDTRINISTFNCTLTDYRW